MFDLDGTLLQFLQDDFLEVYFNELSRVFTGIGMDPGPSIKAVWAGTKSMVSNDGGSTNAQRFWATFSDVMQLTEESSRVVEAACDKFYTNEFNAVKAVVKPSDISARLVRALKLKGYSVVLATNPLFPECAVETRLKWTGLELQDFLLVTHYSNSSFCKPNPDYYREIFAKIGKKPALCLMAGNNPVEDMSAGQLGTDTFLVTDYLENESDVDITGFRRGSLAELESYLMSLPDII